MLPREVIVFLERYIAIPLVGWMLNREIIAKDEQDVWVEIINNVLSVVTMIFLWWLAKHQKQHPVVNTGDVEIEVTQKRRFSLQPVFDWLRNHKVIEIQKSEGAASTGDIQQQQ